MEISKELALPPAHLTQPRRGEGKGKTCGSVQLRTAPSQTNKCWGDAPHLHRKLEICLAVGDTWVCVSALKESKEGKWQILSYNNDLQCGVGREISKPVWR